MANEIEVDLDVSTKRAERELKAFEKDAKSSGARAGNRFEKSFSSGIASLTKRVAGVAATIATAFAGRAVIRAASIQEDAINSLNTSLKNAGSFSQEASNRFQSLASQIQQNSRFGDELIITQSALARNFTRTNEEAEKLITAAVELSAATGMTLDSAVRNLGKTFGGLTGELGESIPQLRGLSAEALKSGAALQFVLDRFGGAASAQINTFAGSFDQLSNTFGDLLEDIGFLITKNPIVIASFGFLDDAIRQVGKNVSESRDNIISFSIVMISSMAKALQTIGNLSLKAGQALSNAFSIEKVGGSLAGIISLLDFGLGNALRGIIKTASVFFKSFITGIGAIKLGLFELGDVANKALSSIGVDLGVDEFIKQNLDKSREDFEVFRSDLNQSFSSLIEQDSVTTLSEQMTNLFNQIKMAGTTEDGEKTIFDQIFEPLSAENLNIIVENYEAAMAKLSQNTASTAEKIKTQMIDVSKTMRQSIVKTSSLLFQQLGRSLAGAGGGFEAFAAIAINALGDLAITIGTTVIAGSKAIEALKLSLPGPPGAGLAAIALGGALIAAGAAFKVLAGSFGGGGAGGAALPAGGAAGGGVAAGGGFQPTTTFSPEEIEERQPSTEVSVNIQGDVLDSDESGLRIVNIINDAFDKQGVKINQGLA